MTARKYPINDIYKCVQGEGCLAGTAMVLVRLQGCGVGCPFCDTKETWALAEAFRAENPLDVLGTNPRWAVIGPERVAELAATLFPGPKWALVTGGEPADHDLYALAFALRVAGYKTAVETSGTAMGHFAAGFDWVCVSPKVGMPGGKPVLSAALAVADEIKMVVGRRADLETLDRLLEKADTMLKPGVQICLQPVSLNEKATDLCVETAMNRGWRVSLQVHKLLRVR